MHIVAASTEKINKGSYFIQKEQSKEKQVNAVYEKIFSVALAFKRRNRSLKILYSAAATRILRT